jgi:hypothetical protein
MRPFYHELKGEPMILLLATGLITFLVYLLILLIVIALVWWLCNQFLPEPLRRYAQAIIVVICVVVLIYLLLGLIGSKDLKL